MGLKLAVVGAGSTYTPEIIEGLIEARNTLPLTSLTLMDVNPVKLRVVGDFAQRMLVAAGMELDCRQTGDLDEALQNADFVVAQIRPGEMRARILDEKIPLKYGLIGQETTGIGGFFNALRTIPQVLHIARRMEVLCPDAWLINFSNPSGLVAQAVTNCSPVRMVGLCNCALNMRRDCREWLKDDEAEIEYAGLNHFAWITRVFSRGEDRLEKLLEGGLQTSMKNIPAVEFDLELLQVAGGIPNGYLSYYYQRNQQLETLRRKPLSRGEECLKIESELLELYQNPELTTKPEQLSRRGGALYSTAAVSLMQSLYQGDERAHVVNVPNGSALPFLEPEDVIEISARVRDGRLEPVPLTKPLNEHMIGLLRTVKAYERETARAALTGDRNAALRALLLHPLVGDFDAAKACFEEMLEAHRTLLPQFFQEEG